MQSPLPIFLVSGISGSGKTTFIKTRIKTQYAGVLVCSADHYFEQGGSYRFDPTKLGKAHGASIRKFAETLAAPFDYDAVVVDNTNTTALELAPYVALANAYGIKPELFTLHVEAKIAHARNQHNVPLRSVERMFDYLERRQLPNFWNITITDLYPESLSSWDMPHE